MAESSVLNMEFPQDAKQIALRNLQEHVEHDFISIWHIIYCDRAWKQPAIELCVYCPGSASLVGLLDMVRTALWNQVNSVFHGHVDHKQPLVLHFALANPQNTAMCYIHASCIKMFSQQNDELSAPKKSRNIFQYIMNVTTFSILPVLWKISRVKHTIKILGISTEMGGIAYWCLIQ